MSNNDKRNLTFSTTLPGGKVIETVTVIDYTGVTDEERMRECDASVKITIQRKARDLAKAGKVKEAEALLKQKEMKGTDHVKGRAPKMSQVAKVENKAMELDDADTQALIAKLQAKLAAKK